MAGLIKDPEDAGRIIAAAITQAEAPNATAKAPETKPSLRLKPKPPPNRGSKRRRRLIRLRGPPSEPMDDTNRDNRRKTTSHRQNEVADEGRSRLANPRIHTRVLLEEHIAKLSAPPSDRHAILLTLQATDAGGKDGAIRPLGARSVRVHHIIGAKPSARKAGSAKARDEGGVLTHKLQMRPVR